MQPNTDSSPAYEAAVQAHDAAMAQFRFYLTAYRANQISALAMAQARMDRNIAHAQFEAAYNAEQRLKGQPA